uniref:Arf-GAP domain-containing protein n=1 Tax=Dromaius novaehollandiae TaxID=8790 RepID=A0A8C4P8F6_DRONO
MLGEDGVFGGGWDIWRARGAGIGQFFFPFLSDPDWASHSLGIFICLNCSGIHRNIPQVSKVKSVRLDDWDDAQVEFMASNGNNVAKAKYESKMPPFYYKPTFLDCQWICAKQEQRIAAF